MKKKRKPKAKHCPKREVFIDACRIQNCYIHECTGDIKLNNNNKRTGMCTCAYPRAHRHELAVRRKRVSALVAFEGASRSRSRKLELIKQTLRQIGDAVVARVLLQCNHEQLLACVAAGVDASGLFGSFPDSSCKGKMTNNCCARMLLVDRTRACMIGNITASLFHRRTVRSVVLAEAE